MKIWPIITLAGLMWGSFYADGQNTARESNPHARPHRSVVDAEVAEAMKAFNPPHRPVTAYRVFFAQLLQQEDGTEWTAPQGKATAEVNGDVDDGLGEQDPGKKLFWRTVVNPLDPIPFTGWSDPNPIVIPDQVAPTPCSSCRPDVTFTFISDDPGPPGVETNAAAEAGSHTTFGNLPFGALQALNNFPGPGAGAGDVITLPCETMLVNGACPLPCKGKDDPLCKAKDPTPPVLSDPGGGLIPPVGSTGSDPPPFIGGGGGGSGMGGGLGGGHSVGGVPEPSTWLLFGLGALALAGFRWRFSAAR